MADSPIWITEADVTSMVSLPDAIGALERVLPLESQGKAQNMTKGHLMVADNDAMHVLGSSVAGEGVCGFKNWINVRGKSETIIELFSMEDGANLAVIEATALGQMRTAAMTGVGTRRLAPVGADEMGIVGSGKQALPQVAACHAVRPLKRLRVFSRNPENRNKFAEAVRAEFDFEVISCETLEETTKDMPIVTIVTNSTVPFLTADMMAKGSHLNAMGAIVAARTEFTDDIFDRADLIAVDNLGTIKHMSAEFVAHYNGDDDPGWNNVRTISELIRDDLTRPEDADITLFKAMGMGLSDLSLAIDIYRRAREEGRGHTLPERVKTPPRLQ
jgi:ornithine cyclodeaminase/alanine dehydrogenase-like protein (mu-crystallin family)